MRRAGVVKSCGAEKKLSTAINIRVEIIERALLNGLELLYEGV